MWYYQCGEERVCPTCPAKTSTATDRLVWRQQLEKGEKHGTQKCLCASKEFPPWSREKKKNSASFLLVGVTLLFTLGRIFERCCWKSTEGRELAHFHLNINLNLSWTSNNLTWHYSKPAESWSCVWSRSLAPALICSPTRSIGSHLARHAFIPVWMLLV